MRRRKRPGCLPLRVMAQGLLPTLGGRKRATILRSLRFPSLEEIQKLVLRDPGIALCTFRYARKMYEERCHSVTSIKKVVAILGTDGMKVVLGQIEEMQVLDSFSPRAMEIGDHSVRVAALSGFLAEQFCNSDPALAYLTGLLHDVGKLLILQAGVLDYTNIPERFNQPNLLNIYERKQLGYDHSRFGWHALSAWHLPEPLPTVVAWHHQGSRAYQVGGTIAHLVALIRAADMLERLIVEPDLTDEDLFWKLDRNLACRQLEITPDMLRQYWEPMTLVREEAILGEM